MTEACRAWLVTRGHPFTRLEALPGDVSLRRYFRIQGKAPSRIVAAYPDALRPACERWIVTDRLLSAGGVRVPRILDADCSTGFMLLEDLGSRTLQNFSSAGREALLRRLEAAVEAADRIAELDREEVAALQPALSSGILQRELDQTWELFLEPRGLVGGADEKTVLRQAFTHLVAELAAAAPVPCHRDFMARNLVPLAEGRIAVLDHQDLRLGPPFYDLASLTNDTLYLSDGATDELLGSRLARHADRLAFHRAAAQRTLKIVGTFEAFRRRGDDRHVRLIRPTLEAALRHLAALPETAPRVPLLRTLWNRPGALLD